MALPKITTADVQNAYVQGQPDKLTGTAQQNKAVFDALPQMIVGKHNEIIDTLNSTDDGDSGADNIGATEIKPGGAQTVQGILDDLGDRVDDADRITALLSTIQSIGPVQNDDTVLPTAKDVLEAMAAAGLGDMLKAYYDPNNNGDKVAKSEDADALGGIPAADYMQYADLDAEPTEDSTTAATSGGTKAYIDRHNVNRNLLHNPYFKIDQRQGYVVPPNKNYYSDTALTTLVGQTSEYTTVTAKASGYNTINIGGTNYYVAVADCVRGYVGLGYGLDRWKMMNNPRVLLASDYLELSVPQAYARICEFFDTTSTKYNGQPLTLSILYKTSESGYCVNFENKEGGYIAKQEELPTSADWTVVSVSTTLTNIEQLIIAIGKKSNQTTSSESLKIKAVKLELGSISTLEAEIESGAYDEDLDLWECRERLQVFDFPINSTLGATLGATTWVNTQLGAYRNMSSRHPTITIQGSLWCSDGWVDLPTPTQCELNGTNAIIESAYSGSLLNGYTSAKTNVRVILSDEL